MKLKYIGILLMFFIVLGAVSASDLSAEDFKNLDFADKNFTVEMDGMKFNIPEGYGNVGIDKNDTDGGVTQQYKFYANEDGEVIMISTMSGDITLDLDAYSSVGENHKDMTIAGKEGSQFEQDGYYFFAYIENKSVVLLQAPEIDMFEDIIL